MSSEELDDEEDDNLGERSREIDCGTSSLQLSDSDDQQLQHNPNHQLSIDQGRGGTPTQFSRYNKARKSSHGHFPSGHWKRRYVGSGLVPASSGHCEERGDYHNSTQKAPGKTPSDANLSMESSNTKDINSRDVYFRPIDDTLEAVANLQEGMATKTNTKAKSTAGIESDSLNENFSPLRPNTKRKRRFKRMALDPEAGHPATTPNIGAETELLCSGISKTTEDLHTEKISSNNNSTDNLIMSSGVIRNKPTAKPDSDMIAQEDALITTNIDPSSSNTGTIKRKKVRSRSAGGTNQLQIMQNVKRVYHGAVAHPPPSNYHHYFPCSSSKATQDQLAPSVIPPHTSMSISTVVPGKRKRSSNREKSVENDSLTHPFSYYRGRPNRVPANSGHTSDVIFENVLSPNKNETDIRLEKNTFQTKPRRRVVSKTSHNESVMMDCDDDGNVDGRGDISSSSLSSSDWESDNDLHQDRPQVKDGKFDSQILIRGIDSDHEADDEQSDWPGQEDVDDNQGAASCSKMQGESVFGLTDDELDNAMLDDPNLMTKLRVGEKNIYGQLLGNEYRTLSRGSTGDYPMDQENLSSLTSTARQAYLARMKRLAECVPGREIRAGSRRLRSRQRGFTIKSSSSEQVSRFLQDSGRSELRLTVLRSADRNKIAHLANLYSLSMRYEDTPRGAPGGGHTGNMLVLTKTGRTLKVDQNPFVTPNTPSSSGGGNISGGWTGSNKHHVDVKRRRKSGPLQSSMDSLSTLNLIPGDIADASPLSPLKMASDERDDSTRFPDPVNPNLNERIELMLETSFNPIVPSAVCLSSSMIAHQGSIPCSGTNIELKKCQDDDDLPAKSSSTTSEEGENEDESPLSSPIMEMATVASGNAVATVQGENLPNQNDSIDGACSSSNITIPNLFQPKFP